MIKITATPDSWTEFALVGIKRERDSSEVQFAALTEDITGLDFGDKDIEGVANLAGGRFVKRISMADESITFKMYPVDVDLSGNGVAQHFHPGTSGTDDTSQPISVPNTNERQKHRLVIVWSTALPATAEGATTSGDPAYRITVSNAYMTSYKPSNDDKQLTAEVTWKWAPFDKAGDPNKREESTDDTSSLPAVTATPTNNSA